MCLIVLAIESHPEYPLVLLANRDEFYARPTAPLHHWPDHPELLAGKDLLHGGTWAGCKGGRLAALTNIRRPGALDPGSASRGELPLRFLLQRQDAAEFAAHLQRERADYAPFNLICGSFDRLHYLSSDDLTPLQLKPGLYGLSNALLDTPWPKLEMAKRGLSRTLGAGGALVREELFDCMGHADPFPDIRLPDTGVPRGWERTLSPPFIHSEEYGTRSTLLLMVDRNGNLSASERSYFTNRGAQIFHQRDFTLPAAR